MQTMPHVTFVIPCYNSADYMRTALDSVLLDSGGAVRTRIEVILVNDGSSDSTADIAYEYETAYREHVRVVTQPNGGHGAAVMAGVKEATGLYIKVVDSDDRLDASALSTVLTAIDSFPADHQPDLIISDYVYDNPGMKKNRRIGYSSFVPARRTVTWDAVSRPKIGRYLLMHALMYKRSVLIESELDLPRHTFYVDNLYASVPLMHTRTLHYVPVPLYLYFIGREDQSVNESVMISRLDQQLRVNRLMIEQIDTSQVSSKSLRRYLIHYLLIITCISLTFCALANTTESRFAARDLLAFLKTHNPPAFRAYRRSPMARILGVRGSRSEPLVRSAYRIARRRFAFN